MALAANPPGDCCIHGIKHEGEATGQMIKIGDIDAYVAYPKDKSTKYGILIAPDVHSHVFINSQLIADQFAANGYFVVLVDLFDGDYLGLERPAGFDIMKWRAGELEHQKHGHGTKDVDPIIDATLVEMKEKFGCQKIGGAGYCFGAKSIIRHLLPGEPHAKLDCGYIAHPSFIEYDEIRDIKGPLAIAAAETDQIFPQDKRHETEKVLQEIGVPYQINLYQGVQHGFAVRGDPKVRASRWAKENAFALAVGWFDEFLKKD